MSLIDDVKLARQEVKAAEKKLKSAKGERSQRVKRLNAEMSKLEAQLTKPQSELDGVKLFVDHVSYGGKSYKLDPEVSVDVSANGVKTDEVDTRSLYLTVTTSSGSFVAKCNPNHENGIRTLGAAIVNASLNAEKTTAELYRDIQKLKVERDIASNDYAKIDAAQDELDAKRAAVDALIANAPAEERRAFDKSEKNRKIGRTIGIVAVVLVLIVAATSLFSGQKPATSDSASPDAASQEQLASTVSFKGMTLAVSSEWKTKKKSGRMYVYPGSGGSITLQATAKKLKKSQLKGAVEDAVSGLGKGYTVGKYKVKTVEGPVARKSATFACNYKSGEKSYKGRIRIDATPKGVYQVVYVVPRGKYKEQESTISAVLSTLDV